MVGVLVWIAIIIILTFIFSQIGVSPVYAIYIVLGIILLSMLFTFLIQTVPTLSISEQLPAIIPTSSPSGVIPVSTTIPPTTTPTSTPTPTPVSTTSAPTTTPPPTLPPLPPVNSVLFVNSESGTMLSGASHEWDISPYWWELEPSSPYVGLGVRIMTDWDFTDAPLPQCTGIPEDDVIFEFDDSTGLIWDREDQTPLALGVPICGVTWTPGSPWAFKLTNEKQGCDINFNWEVQTVVCEIFD